MIGAADPEPADRNGEDWRALQGYQRAMDYAVRRSRTPSFSYSIEFILALHFMITEHNRETRTGCWRSEETQVVDVEGNAVYRAPPEERVAPLMDELVESLNLSDGQAPLVRAAMAHLNLVRIHPFHDGNGRVARCLQTVVAMRDRAVDPVVASLEEYVGRHMRAYNLALRSTGETWAPDRDVSRWLEFCLSAHYTQALALFSEVGELERLTDDLRQRLANHEMLPDVTLKSLGKVFGARPAVIGRWWRMRPNRVIEHLIAESRR